MQAASSHHQDEQRHAAASVTWTPRRLARACMAVSLVPLLTCGAAGRPLWPQAWFVTAAQVLLFAATVRRLPPGLVAERERFLRNSGTPAWDARLALAVVVLTPLAYLAAGLQHRLQPPPPHLPLGAQLAAGALDVAGLALACWALAANRWFSSVVRIQSERGHAVCSAGPYAVLRHPGYAGFNLQGFAEAALLQSSWAAWLVALRTALLALRTLWEEALLAQQLPGYAGYMAAARSRWLPGVW